jgi:hypothetical protein
VGRGRKVFRPIICDRYAVLADCPPTIRDELDTRCAANFSAGSWTKLHGTTSKEDGSLAE